MGFLSDLVSDVVDAASDLVDNVVDLVEDSLELDFDLQDLGIEAGQELFQDLLGIEIPEVDDGASAANSANGTLVTKKGAVAPLPIVYGKRALGGNLIHMVVTGANKEFLWLVYAVADADSPINKFASITMDEVEFVTDNALISSKYSGNVAFEYTLGDHVTQPFPNLAAADTNWTADHLLLGTAAVALKLTWNKDVYSRIPKVLFTVEGSKVLQVESLPTEVRAYSNDPADVLFDYLTNQVYGKGLSIVDGTDINLTSFTDAKTYFGGLVTSYFGGPTHKRMTCDVVLSTGNTVMTNVKKILQCCRGTLPYINGNFYLIPEKHYTPADYGIGSYFNFNMDNVIGRWSFKVGDINSRFNRVKVTFPNEDIAYKPDFIAVESSTFRTEDNSRLLERSIGFDNITNVYRAIDAASVIMRKSRQQLLVSFTAIPAALQVKVGTIVTVTHPTPGWTLKQFRVSTMRLLKSGNVSVTLAEHESTVYDLTVPNEANTSPDTELPDVTVVPDVLGLTLLSNETVLILSDSGTLVPQIKATWTASTNIFVNGYEVEYKKSADSDWLPAGSPNAIGNTVVFIQNVEEGVDYDVRVRAVNASNFAGNWASFVDHTVIGKTSNPSNVASLQALQNGPTVVFKWPGITDRDLAGYEIRYGVSGESTWESAQILTSETKGTNITSADVPPGSWDFFIKALDTGRRYSTTAASTAAAVTNDLQVIDSVNSEPDWIGTAVGFYRHWTGVLVPTSQNLASADGWDTFDVVVNNPTASSSFEASEIDIDFDDEVRVWMAVDTDLAAGETDFNDPVTQLDYKLFSGAYDGFEDWHLGSTTLKACKGKFTLDNTGGIAIVRGFETVVDKAVKTQEGIDVSVAALGSTITFADRFHNPPAVQVSAKGSSALLATYDSVTMVDFKFHLFNTSGTDVGGTGSWEAKGV